MSDVSKYFTTKTIDVPTNIDTQEEEMIFGGELCLLTDWIKHEEFRLKRQDSTSERKLRESNAHRAFIISLIWLLFIAIIIMIYGLRSWTKFILSETEFMFIVGTLSGTVMIYYTIVLNYVFRKGTQIKHKEEK